MGRDRIWWLDTERVHPPSSVVCTSSAYVARVDSLREENRQGSPAEKSKLGQRIAEFQLRLMRDSPFGTVPLQKASFT